jgi:hypothetical protein
VEDKKKANLSWAVETLKTTPGVWFLTNIHPAEMSVNDCPNADRAVKQCINFPTINK